jgi:hypothetical protein
VPADREMQTVPSPSAAFLPQRGWLRKRAPPCVACVRVGLTPKPPWLPPHRKGNHGEKGQPWSPEGNHGGCSKALSGEDDPTA